VCGSGSSSRQASSPSSAIGTGSASRNHRSGLISQPIRKSTAPARRLRIRAADEATAAARSGVKGWRLMACGVAYWTAVPRRPASATSSTASSTERTPSSPEGTMWLWVSTKPVTPSQ